MEQTQSYRDFIPLIHRLATRNKAKAKTKTTTAHFATLRKAVSEARKYGMMKKTETVRAQMKANDGVFTHDLTSTRKLTISRVQEGKWRLAIDVSGRVVPVASMPKILSELL